MSRHTPMPWVANDKHSGLDCIWRVESDALGYPNDGFNIAHLHGPDAEANARLIAAAPLLYEALVDLMEQVESLIENTPTLDTPPFKPAIVQRAKAAIDAAGGEGE